MSAPEHMRRGRLPIAVVLVSVALFAFGVLAVIGGFNGMVTGSMPLPPAIAATAMGVLLMALGIGAALGAERGIRGREARAAFASGSTTAEPRPKRARLAADRLLAEWTLAPDEWRAWNQGEARAARGDLVNNTLVGVGFGIVVVKMWGGPWLYAALSGGVLGAAILAGSLRGISRTRNREPKMGGAVTIRGGVVEIDGERSRLADDGWHLSGARLRTDLPLAVIEISTRKTKHDRNGSRRSVEKVLRVPVPRGREEQAGHVAELLSRGAVTDPDDD